MKKKYQRIVVISDFSTYADGLANATEAAIKAKGGNVVSRDKIKADSGLSTVDSKLCASLGSSLSIYLKNVLLYDDMQIDSMLNPGEALAITCTEKPRGLGKQFFGNDAADHGKEQGKRCSHEAGTGSLPHIG